MNFYISQVHTLFFPAKYELLFSAEHLAERLNSMSFTHD